MYFMSDFHENFVKTSNGTRKTSLIEKKPPHFIENKALCLPASINLKDNQTTIAIPFFLLFFSIVSSSG